MFSPAAIPSTTLLPSPTGSPNRPEDPEGTGNNNDRNEFLTTEGIIIIICVVVVLFFIGILLIACAYCFTRKRAKVLKLNQPGSFPTNNSATQVTTVSMELDTKQDELGCEPTPSTFIPVHEKSNDEEKAQMAGEVGENETTTNESGTNPTAPAQTPQQVKVSKKTKKRMGELTTDLPKLQTTVNIKENENRVSCHFRPEHGEGNSGGEKKKKEGSGKAPADSLGARKPKRNGGGEEATKPPKPNGREALATQKNAESDRPSAQNNSNKASATTSPPSGNRRSSSISPGRQAPPPPPPNNGKRTPARSSSNNAATTARTPSSTSPSATRSPTSQPQHGARPKKTK